MRRHLAYAAGAAVLALVGCGGDDPTPRVADPTSSASVSASPSAGAAVEKEAWEKKTEAGAVAFAKRWIRLFDEAKSSGDTGELAAVSSSDCKTCQNYISLTDDIYGNGGSVKSEGWRVLAVSTPSGDETPIQRVSMRIDQSPQEIKRSADADAEQFDGGEATFTASVRWVGDGWLMTSLDIVE